MTKTCETFVYHLKYVKESTVMFVLCSGNGCLVDRAPALGFVFTLVVMENPPSPNFSSMWSLFAIMTQIFLFLADYYKHTCHISGFPTLHGGSSLSASPLLIQQHAFFCFLSPQSGRTEKQRENEDLLIGVTSWDAPPTHTLCFSEASRS